MNLELVQNLQHLKKIINCDIAIEACGQTIATNDNIEYLHKYQFDGYCLNTSQVLNKQILELINFYFKDYFAKLNNSAQYFNAILDGKQQDYSLISVVNKYMVLLQVVKADEVYEILKDYLDQKDYLFIRNKQELVILINSSEIANDVNTIKNLVETELMMATEQLQSCYEDCQALLALGKIFHNANDIYHNHQQMVERLIYASAPEARLKFLNKYPGIETLNNEDINTVKQLLVNNLNVAQTARVMYMHRNTLLYRIDKIYQKVNLNVLNFDDAMTLKILIIIKNILQAHASSNNH